MKSKNGLKGQRIKRLRDLFIFLSFILLASYPVFASSGASFLKIPVGARAVGMGNAYTAVANDISALYWNPAGLNGMRQKEFSFMHAQLFADTRFNFIGYAMPLKKEARNEIREASNHSTRISDPASQIWTLGIGAIYLNQDAIEGRDDNRNKTGNFSASDLAFNIGMSHKISNRSSAGIGLKMIRQSLASESANGFAADIGLLTRTPKLNLGMSVLNIGSSLKFRNESFSLPLTFSLGAGYLFKKEFMVSFDFKHRPMDHVSSIGLGTELLVFSAFSLRAGYLNSLVSVQKTKENNTFIEQLSGFGTGFGLKLRSTQVDYAITPMGELGANHRISLTIHF